VKSKYGFKDRINVGTPLYMPPETIMKTYYSSKSDIFALGVILYEMIEGKTPWESSNEKELLEKLKKELVLPENMQHPKIREFIVRCCQLNEAKRMSKD
jgi:serine/threonine protein kinase